MGKGYLMDSNVIIDYLGNKLPIKSAIIIDRLPIVISVITKIEITGRYNASKQQIQKIASFTEKAFIYPLSEEIIEQTISIRQKDKIKLPDAIIAATAMVNNHILVTHNISDFATLKNLKVIDSWSMQP